MLSNGLLAGASVPVQAAANRMEPIPEADVQMLFRKVDRGSSLVMVNHNNGDIYVTG